MSKRFSKEELQHDALIDFYTKAFSIYHQYKKLIIWGGSAFVLIVAGLLGYFYYTQSQEQKAQRLLGVAEQHFRQGDYRVALDGSDSTLTIGFAQIADNFPFTDASNLATYYSAVCEYKLGNPEKSLDYIKDYDVPDGILGVGPISLHATLLDEVGKHEEAANMYIKASEWDENDSTTPYNLYQAASSYFQAKNYKQSRRLVEQILNQYADSDQAADAEKLKGRLLTASL